MKQLAMTGYLARVLTGGMVGVLGELLGVDVVLVFKVGLPVVILLGLPVVTVLLGLPMGVRMVEVSLRLLVGG